MRLFRGTEDICEKVKKLKDDEKAIFAMLSIPDHCPVEKAKLCPDKEKRPKLDKLGKFLPMAVGSPVQINANITHDTVIKFSSLLVFKDILMVLIIPGNHLYGNGS